MPEDALFMGRYPARSRVRSDLVSTLLAGRQEGKTTRLIEWLLQGERIDSWPSWSRVLIVAEARQIEPIRSNYTAADQQLREQGCVGGLGKVVLSVGSYSLHRLRLSDVEVAVDNAEDLITQQLGFRPDVVSMTGALFGADVAHTPRKDAKGVLHLWYPIDRQWGHVGRKIGPCADQECPDFGRDSAGHRLEEQ
jgi:hypothetical protein